MTNIAITPAQLQHHNFIFDSFVREYSRLHDIPTAILWSGLFGLLHDSDWKCAVALSPEDSDEFMGWVLYLDTDTSNTLAWLYVKPQYRNWGVATALLAHAEIGKGNVDVAYFSPRVAKLAKAKGYTLRWRPYLPAISEIKLAELLVDLEGV